MRAVVVIGYQNDYVSGPRAVGYAKMIEGNICNRIESTLRSGGDLFILMDSYNGDQNDGLCIKGTWGAELAGRLNDYESKGHIIQKQKYGSEELVNALLHYNEVEICGLDTNKDILVNAVLLHNAYPKMEITVKKNCIASRDSALAEETADVLTGIGVIVK